MRRGLILLCMATMTMQASFAQESDTSYGAARVVLYETDPWLMVVGSDVPVFALYENGQVIYQPSLDESNVLKRVVLSQSQAQAFLTRLGIANRLDDVPDHVNASNWTDQPTNILILNFTSPRQITVYGNLRGGKSEARELVPSSFLEVFDALSHFTSDSAETWLPEKFEVMLTGYDYSPEHPIEWPVEWPNITSPGSIKRDDDLFSVYLDKKYFKAFLNLQKSMKQKQAVKVNGRKFSVSYRLPFPNLK